MAKTIKFNLICNEKPIRTIEDLQNNFVIEDVLDLYQHKLLERWLEVRGYTEELGKLKRIKSDEQFEIIKELIDIFNVETDRNKVEEVIYIYKYKRFKDANYEKHQKCVEEEKGFIIKSINSYNELVSMMFSNPNDVSIIKSSIKDIIKYYYPIFELNHRELFYKLIEVSELAILCLLMYEETRKFYIYDVSQSDYDKQQMYNLLSTRIRKLILNNNSLNGNIITYKQSDKGFWNGVTKLPCMVLSVCDRDKEIIRETGKIDKVFKYNDIRPLNDFTFPIFYQGIEHTVTTDCYNPSLIYMII